MGSPVATQDQFQTISALDKTPLCVARFRHYRNSPLQKYTICRISMESASAYLEHPELCSFQPQRRWFVEGIDATVGKWVAKRTLFARSEKNTLDFLAAAQE